VHDERGLIGVVDAVFTAERLVVELEGLRFHTTPEQRGNDAARFNRLGMAGWLPLRYTWLDVVRQPGAVAGELRQALARRRRVD
jgi:very-short-patch-repair endonuclease